MTTPTHADLVTRAHRWLRGFHRCPVVFAEMTAAPGYFPDAIGWHFGFSILVECKISRSDFFADRKKGILDNPDDFPGEERWYLTPPGLLKAADIPPGWHLAESDGRTVSVITHPPVMPPAFPWHESWGTPPTPPDPARHPGMWARERNAARSAAGVPYLLSAVRRHEVGVRWLSSEARFESIARRERREADEMQPDDGAHVGTEVRVSSAALAALPGGREAAEGMARDYFAAEADIEWERRTADFPRSRPLLWMRAPTQANVAAYTRLLCDLSRPASVDWWSRWLAERVGLTVGATAPRWGRCDRAGSESYRSAVGFWCLCGSMLTEHQWHDFDDFTPSKHRTRIPGISTLTDPRHALVVACLAVGGGQ